MVHHLDGARRLASVCCALAAPAGTAAPALLPPPPDGVAAPPRLWPEWAREARGVAQRVKIGLERAFSGPLHTRALTSRGGRALWAAEARPLAALLSDKQMPAEAAAAAVRLRLAGWPEEMKKPSLNFMLLARWARSLPEMMTSQPMAPLSITRRRTP